MLFRLLELILLLYPSGERSYSSLKIQGGTTLRVRQEQTGAVRCASGSHSSPSILLPLTPGAAVMVEGLALFCE